MELLRSNTLSEIEKKAITLPKEQVIIIDSTNSYFYLYDDGELLRDMVNVIYHGPRFDWVHTVEEYEAANASLSQEAPNTD